MKIISQTSKTNWKFIALVAVLGLLVGGAILMTRGDDFNSKKQYVPLPTQTPKAEIVEQVVYTKAGWSGSIGSVRDLRVANVDGSGRRIFETLRDENIDSLQFFLSTRDSEVVVLWQDWFGSYKVHVEKINLNSAHRTALGTYEREGIHGAGLENGLLSPDQDKLAFVEGKDLFIIPVRGNALESFQPTYSHAEGYQGVSITAEVFDSLGNVYLKSFTGSPGENLVIYDLVKVSAAGKRTPLPKELQSFVRGSGSGSSAFDFRPYPSPDGNFIAWVELLRSLDGELKGSRIQIYSTREDRTFTVQEDNGEERMEYLSIEEWAPDSQYLFYKEFTFIEPEKVIAYNVKTRTKEYKENLTPPIHKVEVVGENRNTIAGSKLYIDEVLIDSVEAIYADYYGGPGLAFEVLGFMKGVPIQGVEKTSEEKEMERQKAELEAFKKVVLYPTYLPPTWTQKSESGGEGGLAMLFHNESGGVFTIQQQKPNLEVPKGYIQIRNYLSEYPEELITSKEYGVLDENQGLYFTVGKSRQLLIWSKGDMDIAIACFGYDGCTLGKEELIRIAESMEKQM